MSPHAANSLVADLVEMAQAVEELPKVQAELADARTVLASMDIQVHDRDQTIVMLNASIETLRSQLKQAEVSRDDAEYRFLEATDNAATLRGLVENMGKALGLVVSEPVKVPETAPITTQPETAQAASVTTEAAQEPTSTVYEPPTDTTVHDQGISVQPSPTAAPIHADATLHGADGQDAVQSAAPGIDTSGPYYGKRYMDIPGFVPYHDWLAGGGTQEGYYAR